jgi:3-methylfumaryl-CoA hydratase
MKDAIGRTRKQIDALDPVRAAALHATLGRPGPVPEVGDPLPPFWHYAYFWDMVPAAGLGRDGHPMVGGFLPDTGLPRRMWAGGTLTFDTPAVLGAEATKTSRILDATVKQGRSGRLAVVRVEHVLKQGDDIRMREVQDLIYREDPAPGAPAPTPPEARRDEAERRSAAFDPTLLFRYSALTFNGHRIHYDRDYCREVEGYPGLVVHGPLLAQLLIHMAEDLLGGVRTFRFRATAPLFDFEPADLCARPSDGGLDLWVRGPDGRQCMTASAS